MAEAWQSTRSAVHGARLCMTAVLIAVPLMAHAQDDRIDDPPDPPELLQGGGGSGSSPHSSAGGALFAEPKIVTLAIDSAIESLGDSVKPSNGFYPELSNMITGSGFVSLGPGYRRQVFNRRAFVDTSAAASWHWYKMAQARLEFPDLASHRVTAGVQGMWQDETQVNYFGIGSNAPKANESQYRLQSTDIVGYASVRPVTSLSIGGELGWLGRPDIMTPGGTFRRDVPTTESLFPTDPGSALPFQPNLVHSEASLTADTRDNRSRPTRGSVYRAAVTDYNDQSTNAFSFREFEAEGLQFVRLRGPSWILAAHGWAVATDVPSGHVIPFYLLPSLGGNNTLRSFSDYRFHDRNLLLVNVESRWAIFTHVDAALFVDAGNVAPAFRDVNLDKRSYGGGIRFHTARATFARFDVAHGAEGWTAVIRTSDPFRLARLTRRVAGIPFVP